MRKTVFRQQSLIGALALVIATTLSPTLGNAGTLQSKLGMTQVYRWIHGDEHFYTSDKNENYWLPYMGLSAEGVGFHVWTASSAAHDRPLYRVQGALGHIYLTSSSELAWWQSQGYTYQGIVGYLSATPTPGTLPVHAWREACAGYPNQLKCRRFLSTGWELGSSNYEGVLGYAPVPYRVGVYYFGMWSDGAFEEPPVKPADFPFPAWTASFYTTSASPRWWRGVQELFDGTPIKHFNAFNYSCGPSEQLVCNFEANSWAYRCVNPQWESYRTDDDNNPATARWAFLQPRIGWYDLRDRRAIESHIEQASQNGVSYFSFYWWYGQSYGGNEFLNDGLNSFLVARNRDKMSFSIYIEDHWASANTINAGNRQKAVATLVNYFGETNYLKSSDGRPIVTIGTTSGIWDNTMPGDDKPEHRDWPGIYAFINDLKVATWNALGVQPLIAVNVEDPAVYNTGCVLQPTGYGTYYCPAGCTSCIGAISYADAATCLTVSENWENERLNPVRGINKPLMPCTYQRFDERPRMLFADRSKVNPQLLVDHEFSSPGGVHKFLTREPPNASMPSSRPGLYALRRWVDTQDDELSHIVTLYAWNEWHEGGIIEPNIRDGAAVLNDVNSAFELPQGTDLCRISGACNPYPLP